MLKIEINGEVFVNCEYTIQGNLIVIKSESLHTTWLRVIERASACKIQEMPISELATSNSAPYKIEGLKLATKYCFQVLNNKIECIKMVRNITGWGLKESKELVDEVISSLGW